jgi:hypothetical protein
MAAIEALIRELEKAFVIVQRRDILVPSDGVCVVGEFEDAAFTADIVILDGTRAPGGVWVVVHCVSRAGFARV